MTIERNLATWDRMLRAVAACLIFGFWMVDLISGPATYVLMILAGLLLFNSFVGRCWLYGMLGVSTCTPKKKE